MFNKIVQGWINYYGRFYKSRLLTSCAVNRHLNEVGLPEVQTVVPPGTAGHAMVGRGRWRTPVVCPWRLGHRPTAGQWELNELRGSSPVLRGPRGAIPLGHSAPCSGSPDRRPKPSRSNSAWPGSCATTSELELSQDKTLITHARTGAARFLGYEITVQHNDRKVTRGQRSGQRHVGLRVPGTVIKAKSAPYLTRGKPARRPR